MENVNWDKLQTNKAAMDKLRELYGKNQSTTISVRAEDLYDCVGACGFAVPKSYAVMAEKTCVALDPVPEKVIFNPPATIVYWNDGTKTVVKCGHGDRFDKEKGVALCYMKRAFDNSSGKFNRQLKEAVQVEDSRKESEKTEYCPEALDKKNDNSDRHEPFHFKSHAAYEEFKEEQYFKNKASDFLHFKTSKEAYYMLEWLLETVETSSEINLMMVMTHAGLDFPEYTPYSQKKFYEYGWGRSELCGHAYAVKVDTASRLSYAGRHYYIVDEDGNELGSRCRKLKELIIRG